MSIKFLKILKIKCFLFDRRLQSVFVIDLKLRKYYFICPNTDIK